MNLRIVVTDEREANFFDTSKLTGPLTDRGSVQNSAAGLKDTDLETDRPGRRYGGTSSVGRGNNSAQSHHHGVGGDRSTVQHDVELFARAVAHRIESDRVNHGYDKLLLIAPPKMLGLLRQLLSTPARALVAGEISKDLLHHDDKAILKAIPQDTFFH